MTSGLFLRLLATPPKTHLAALAICGLTCLGWGTAARADMLVTLVNDASTVNRDDSATPGNISYYGPVGVFSATITIATSNSPGTAGDSLLKIVSLDVINTATSRETLSILLSGTGFSNPSGSLLLGSSYAGNFTSAQAGDSTSFQSFVDTTDTLDVESGPSTGIQSFNLSSSSLQSFNDTSAPASFFAAGPYSLTNQTIITLSPGAEWSVTGITEVTPAGVGNGNAPEPATLALIAPVAFFMLARRRRVPLR